jgi:hypothetical protein
MNIVKQAGLGLIVLASLNVIAGGFWFITVPLVFGGIWIFLLGGLSGH